MLVSRFEDLGAITFPVWSGRQKYMNTVDPSNPRMDEGFEDYNDVIRQLCGAAGYAGPEVHVTVDEKVVQPGCSQRRPDAHVDGHFQVDKGVWGHNPGWNHFCNEVPIPRMSVIVGASVAGCIGYRGEFDGVPKNDGDLEHIRDQLGAGELLPANRGFLLSPDCVHESIRYSSPTKRGFLRIALPPVPAI